MLLRLLAHLNLPKPQLYLIYDPHMTKWSMILKLKLWLGMSLMMAIMLTWHWPMISLQLAMELPGGLQLTSPASLFRTI
jgi:hypothetical protein